MSTFKQIELSGIVLVRPALGHCSDVIHNVTFCNLYFVAQNVLTTLSFEIPKACIYNLVHNICSWVMRKSSWGLLQCQFKILF